MSFTAVESPQRSRWWPRIQRSPRRDADLLGRLDRSLVIDDAGFDVVAEFLDQLVDVDGLEADAVQIIVGAQLPQQLGQRRLVPLGELVGPVVSDGVGRRV